MVGVVTIVVDIYERPSKIAEILRELGAVVDIRRLGVADYDLGGGTLVERKSVLDLHSAILKGRLWTQVGRLRESAIFPYVLVEGADLANGPVAIEAIRGALLAVTDLGVPVLRSTDQCDSAAWLRRLAIRRAHQHERDRPAFAQRPKRRRHSEPAEAMLAAVPGVSVVTARSLLARFESVAGVVAATESELLSVAGVGRSRARALTEALNGRTSHSA